MQIKNFQGYQSKYQYMHYACKRQLYILGVAREAQSRMLKDQASPLPAYILRQLATNMTVPSRDLGDICDMSLQQCVQQYLTTLCSYDVGRYRTQVCTSGSEVFSNSYSLLRERGFDFFKGVRLIIEMISIIEVKCALPGYLCCNTRYSLVIARPSTSRA